jgi:hypothetical protein
MDVRCPMVDRDDRIRLSARPGAFRFRVPRWARVQVFKDDYDSDEE